MKNLPNFLTFARILLVPILVTVLFTKVDDKEWWGLALFLLAALTDFLVVTSANECISAGFTVQGPLGHAPTAGFEP